MGTARRVGYPQMGQRGGCGNLENVGFGMARGWAAGSLGGLSGGLRFLQK